jgi:hypothetical protein
MEDISCQQFKILNFLNLMADSKIRNLLNIQRDQYFNNWLINNLFCCQLMKVFSYCNTPAYLLLQFPCISHRIGIFIYNWLSYSFYST